MDGHRSSQALIGLAVVVANLSGCAPGQPQPPQECDPEAVALLESLPPFPGVEVDLHLQSDDTPQVPDDQDCVAVLTPPDPEVFQTHYEQAMRDAGWTIRVLEPGNVLGVTEEGSGVSVSLDTHEPGNVRVWLGVFPPGRLQP